MTLEAELAPTSLKAGDILTIPVFIDRRNWWQRRAPLWLGGKPKPIPERRAFTITWTTMQGPFE